ncbi:MAG: RNA polymerase sigma-70 factor [Myxococcota bacterium]|nr:RNA polymerase sigma-70 factor [Myxococcota bacterium]
MSAGDPAALYLEHRPFLIGLAYRMLGSVAEAEDAVQEAFLRAHRTPRDGAWSTDVESPRAWLATVVTRLCLDQLRSARARRETYTGPWLPEPVRTDLEGAIVQPIDAEAAESLSLAFLVLLERLSPLERAVFLLHDVFDYTHAEVGAMLERDEAAVRQLLHRAKAHVKQGRPRFAPDPDRHRELLVRFLGATGQGDLAALTAMLTDDVVARSDGGGKVRAAIKPVVGGDRVARLLIGVAKKSPADLRYELCEINGTPGVTWSDDAGLLGAMTIVVADDRICEVDIVVNPEKLRALASLDQRGRRNTS